MCRIDKRGRAALCAFKKQWLWLQRLEYKKASQAEVGTNQTIAHDWTRMLEASR